MGPARITFVAVAALLASFANVALARADDPPPASLWDPAWPRVGLVEVGVSGVVAGGGLLGAALVKDDGPPRWTHGVLFDDGARDALRASSGSGQSRASAISDGMEIALLVAPLASAGGVWALRHDGPTALQLLIIDAEAYALTEATVGFLKVAIHRERPDAAADGCDARPADADCVKRVGKNSFPSNHAGSTFVAASLLCTEHLHLGIAGAPYDAGICATSLAAATAVSVLRVVADRHYVSDIVVGSMIGGLYGWLMPTLLHFHGGGASSATSAVDRPRVVAVQPMISKAGVSIGATLLF